MARYLYSELSSLVQAHANCVKSGNTEWMHKHADNADGLVKEHMPSGSGFDSGTKLDWDASHAEKLVFTTAFHHINENGYYDGWTEHVVTVTPSLAHGFNMRVSGRNRNDIKEYIGEMFRYALQRDVEWDVIRTWPRVEEMRIESKFEWIDQSRGEHVVRVAEEEKMRTNNLELARAFMVEWAKTH